MSKFYTLLFFFIIQLSVKASDNKALITINDTPIYIDDFKRVYEKNNFDNASDYSEKSLNEYLDLFIQFRLKLLDAQRQGIPESPSVKDEYNTYVQQLYNNYYDKKNTHQLVLDAYERMQYDISISHIFIKFSDKEEVDENKIKSYFDKLETGEEFEAVAEKYSEDNYSATKGGYLGYFTGMQISLPELEDRAFTTPVGAYSLPFNTNAGYHILKVNDKRPAVGKIKISIIKKTKIQNDEEYNMKAKNQIEELYNKLLSGEDFAQLAKTNSDDVYSRDKGGEIDWFGISTYALDFESVAFSLENIGDISQPFETNYAWYIIKKDAHLPVSPLEDIYNALKAQIYKSSRFELEKEKHIQEILKKYGYSEITSNFTNFKNAIVEKLKNEERIVYNEKENPKDLIQIVGTTYNENELGTYINRYITRSIKRFPADKFDNIVNDFVQDKAISFHKDKLGEEDKEYGNLLKEYMEGIILFEIMSTNIWNKAIEDTAGLSAFFKDNKQRYYWEEKGQIEVYELPVKRAKFFEKQLKKKNLMSGEAWSGKLSGKGVNKTSDKEILREEVEKYKLNWEKNSFSKEVDNGNLIIYLFSEIIPQKQKTLQEARGFVIADYQKYLEREWVNRLKQEFDVEVDNKVLQSLIKK